MSLHASELRNSLRGFHGAIREAVPLAPLTHVRIGGAAQFFAEPKTEADVGLLVQAARDFDLSMRILGGGSNLLVDDAGVQGLVVSLVCLNRVMRDGDLVTAGAGVTLPSLIRGTKDQGLAGLELLIGVPAVVGGAVAMNAGTRDTETFAHLVSLTVVDASGELSVIGKDQFQPSYRNGGLGESIVVQATFSLQEDNPQAIYKRMETSLKRRNATQPVTEKSVGCVFKNPAGESAGGLIERAGCKTIERGPIAVSEKHANYFVNRGGGTSQEFLDLLADVQGRVLEEFQIKLEPEVQLWGVQPK